MDSIAVIIPNYNRVDLLRRILKALCAQTHPNFVVVVVDSSDTDKIDAVVREYSSDSRFHFLLGAQKGLPKQRNAGIQFAHQNFCPDFYTFIDSDDYVVATYLSDLLQIQLTYDSDLTITKLFRSFDISSLPESANTTIDSTSLDPYSAVMSFFHGIISPSACGKLYRSHILEHVQFDESLVFNEDYEFTLRALLYSKLTVTAGYYGYIYWQGGSSMTRQKSLSNAQLLSMIEANIKMAELNLPIFLDDFQKESISNEIMQLLADNFLSAYPRLNIGFKARRSYLWERKRAIKRSETVSKAVQAYRPYNRQSRLKKNMYLLCRPLYVFLSRLYFLIKPGRYCRAPRSVR